MAMKKYTFYQKTDGIWIVNGNEFPPGTLNMIFDPNDNTIVRFIGNNNYFQPIPFIPINKIEKNIGGDFYIDKAELQELTKNFFKAAFAIVDENGSSINPVNPIPTSVSNLVHISEVSFINSDSTGWTGTLDSLFDGDENTSLFNDSGDNPKSFILNFKLAIQSFICALSTSSGSFSNLRITGLFGGIAEQVLYDKSTIDTPAPFAIIELPDVLGFGGLKFEFVTVNRIDLASLTIAKYGFGINIIRGENPNGDFINVNTNILGNLLVSLDEQKDAFGRLKTAEPFTIFDNSLTSEFSDTLFWSTLLNGTGTGNYDRNSSKYELITAADGDYVVRQTKVRMKYQPAKSHEFFITGLWATELGQRKRAGLVDYDNVGLVAITNEPQNGVFFENNAGVLSWNICNNGIITENKIQSEWNIDTADGLGRSGFLFNPNVTNILACQLEWLGVGVVLVGFAVGAGSVIYVHAFQHASVEGFVDVYMRTANLPVSYELTSITGAGSMKQICSSVISGGGFNPKGLTNAVRNVAPVPISSGDTELLCGIRMKEDSFEFTIEPKSVSILSVANGNSLWFLSINPVYSGSVTWNDKPDTELQEAINNNNLITNEGIILIAGSFSNNADNLSGEVETALRIGKDLLGARDELWLCATAIGNENYYGTINFKELL